MKLRRTRALPKRTPDPARKLVGGYQKLLSEFMRTAQNYGVFLPEGLLVDFANHVEGIHKESLAFLAEVGEEMRSRG